MQKVQLSALNPNLVGAIWLLGAVICFLASYTTVKYAGETLPSIQIVFLRSIFQMLLVAPLMMRIGFENMKSKQIKNYFIRLTFGATNIVLTFYAVSHLPLATSTSLIYTRPLFTIILAALLLRENVGWRRGIATFVGFIGILVILNPDKMGLSLAEFSALGGSFFLALTYIYIQKLSRTENHFAMLMWFGIACCLYTAYPAYRVWEPVNLRMLGIVFVIAATATCAQYCIIRGYQIGKATVISPVDYLQIPLSALLGLLFFGEEPTWNFAIGSMIIIGSSVYILRKKCSD